MSRKPTTKPTATENTDTDTETMARATIVDVAKKHVTATYNIRKSNGGPRHTLTTVFDFSDVSTSELYQLAMYGVRVKTQAMWRARDIDPLRPNVGFERINVKTQIVDATRAPRDPATTATNMLDKLSPEQLAEILAKYGDKIPKRKAAYIT